MNPTVRSRLWAAGTAFLLGFVVANVGTTNTGAVDPLPEILRIARAHGLWVHADAAYGGFFRLAAGGEALLRGIEQCDSITLDPHKGLFLPYGLGALLVRDGAALVRTHRESASYVQDVTEQNRRNQAREIIAQRKADEEFERFLRQLRSEAYVESRLASPEAAAATEASS